ncbi:hypothetical protein FQP85_08675 [Pseudoalteromonas neustonica]|uniref:EpsG family protein n=1 Tax=Pseudoalteromonas neustonica TaxID=1840331 RepID=A0ABY3FFH4_9GAMM|nr:hypothetical protein [Pseudoalteromonas neustonica]TVU83839.1 hypothetical protein FQP85_08675 [Pseudoalteromonas neustonica]
MYHIKNHKSILLAIQGIIYFIVFGFSILISFYYIGGDQVHYSKVYSAIEGMPLKQAFLYYYQNLSSSEVIHFLYVYAGSNLGVPKALWLSIVNVMLFHVFIKFLLRVGFSYFLAYIIVITNFYIYMLYFAGERLKFGILFLLLSYCMYLEGKLRKGVICVFLAIISHVQILLYYIGVLSYSLTLTFKGLLTGKVNKLFLLLLTGFLISFSIIYPHFINKINSYIGFIVVDYSDFAKVFTFAILTILCCKNRTANIFFYFIMLIFVIFLGTDRLVLFFLLYFYSQYESKTKYYNLVLYLLTIYLSFKSFVFISNIVYFGDGFYSGT